VLTALDDLRKHLLEYLDCSDELARTLAPARHAATALCDALSSYAGIIQLARSRITRVKGIVLQAFDAVENWNGVSADHRLKPLPACIRRPMPPTLIFNGDSLMNFTDPHCFCYWNGG
jgi:hypothetical protein